MSTTSQREFERLLKGKRPCADALETLDGRSVFRDIVSPKGSSSNSWMMGKMAMSLVTGLPLVRSRSWIGLHFIGCDLSDLSWDSSYINNCVFERCDMTDGGLWNSSVSDTQFKRCNMERFRFGGIDYRSPCPNEFYRITIEGGSIAGSFYSCELFDTCLFRRCGVRSVHFNGSIFRNCIFEGTLKDVIFRRYSKSVRNRPPNLLEGCDFRRARLVHVEFMNIDIDPTMLPDDDDLLILPRGPEDWLEWGQLIKDDRFAPEMARRAGKPSVINLSTLARGFDEDEIQALVEIARRSYST